jgi:hypothetical protein
MKTQIQTTAWTPKNMLVLGSLGSRYHSVDFKAREAQFGHTRFYGALNFPENNRNPWLCSESLGILQMGKTKTLWERKRLGNL